jgi:hypothetical protein
MAAVVISHYIYEKSGLKKPNGERSIQNKLKIGLNALMTAFPVERNDL